MKYAAGIGALIIGALIVWYVYTNNQTQETAEGTTSSSSESLKAQASNPDQSAAANPGVPNEDGATAGIVSDKDGPRAGSGKMEDVGSGDDENEEEDYSEPVSKEDFKDFINTALDELAEDETTALAIVKEMDKIAKAQPNHEEEVERFYRECTKRTKVSKKVQEACIQAQQTR